MNAIYINTVMKVMEQVKKFCNHTAFLSVINKYMLAMLRISRVNAQISGSINDVFFLQTSQRSWSCNLRAKDYILCVLLYHVIIYSTE
jgi:hypothetical protein